MEAENTDKAILRRLETIQAFADRQRPAVVTVHFADGSTTVIDQSGALGLLQKLGPHGKIDSFQVDGLLSEWAKLMTIVLHPAKNRRLEDFE